MYRVVTSINQPNSRERRASPSRSRKYQRFTSPSCSIVKKAPAESSFATQPSVGWLTHRVAASGIDSRNIVARHANGNIETIRVIFRACAKPLSFIKWTAAAAIFAHN